MGVIYEYLENVCEILDSYRISITAKICTNTVRIII